MVEVILDWVIFFRLPQSTILEQDQFAIISRTGEAVCHAANRRQDPRQQRYPLITPKGRSRATRIPMPAAWTT